MSWRDNVFVKSIESWFLSPAAWLFSCVYPIRVPLICAILVGYLFYYPDQILELYRISAADVSYILFRDDYSLWDIHFSNVFYPAAFLFLTYLMYRSTWEYIALSQPASSDPAQPTASVNKFMAAAPGWIASIPIIGIGFGHVSAFTYSDDKDITRTLAFEFGFYLVLAALVIGYQFLVPFRENKPPAKPKRLILLDFVPIIILAGVIGVIIVFMSGIDKRLGSLVLACLFLSSLFVIILYVSTLSKSSGIPLILCIVLFSIGISSFGWNDNRSVRLLPAAAAPAADARAEQDAGTAFTEWLGSRQYRRQEFKKAGKKFPVYIVAAEGGGMYAALHSATVLSRLQDICPAFFQHVFAISSVSGGSLGSSVFTALVNEQLANFQPPATDGPDCVLPAVKRVGGNEITELAWNKTGLESKVRTFFQSDLLSPVVGSFLFPDFLQRMWPRRIPGFARAVALETAIEDTWQSVDKSGQNPFRSHFLDAWKSQGAAPALILNATDVGSGERVIISPFRIDGPAELLHFPIWSSIRQEVKPPKDRADIALSTAVVLSARFPWLTPAGSINARAIRGVRDRQDREPNLQSKPVIMQIVDGGYVENSGVATALDLVSELKTTLASANGGDDVELHVIVITSDFQKQDQNGQVGDLATPIAALLSSREARGRLEIRRAWRELGVQALHVISLKDKSYTLPLGWQLSLVSREVIQSSVGHPANCSGDVADANCALAGIIRSMSLDRSVKPPESAPARANVTAAKAKIDRARAYACMRTNLFGGALKRTQVDGLDSIVNYWDGQPELRDLRWLAYILATVYHETDRTFQAVRQFGAATDDDVRQILDRRSQRDNVLVRLSDPNGQSYYGRGFIQLTYGGNYDKVGKLINLDLYNNPDLALDPANAAKIAVVGLTQGVFTGKKLSHYFNDDAEDWVNARRIVSGSDKAQLIAGYGQTIYSCLRPA